MGSHKLTMGDLDQAWKGRGQESRWICLERAKRICWQLDVECVRERSQRQPQGGWDAMHPEKSVEGTKFSGLSSGAHFGHLTFSLKIGLTM